MPSDTACFFNRSKRVSTISFVFAMRGAPYRFAMSTDFYTASSTTSGTTALFSVDTIALSTWHRDTISMWGDSYALCPLSETSGRDLTPSEAGDPSMFHTLTLSHDFAGTLVFSLFLLIVHVGFSYSTDVNFSLSHTPLGPYTGGSQVRIVWDGARIPWLGKGAHLERALEHNGGLFGHFFDFFNGHNGHHQVQGYGLQGRLTIWISANFFGTICRN